MHANKLHLRQIGQQMPRTCEKNEVTSHQEVALRYLNPTMDKEFNFKRSFCSYLIIYYVHTWNTTNKDMCICMQFIIENLKCSIFWNKLNTLNRTFVYNWKRSNFLASCPCLDNLNVNTYSSPDKNMCITVQFIFENFKCNFF
jgi:hypothetical protein